MKINSLLSTVLLLIMNIAYAQSDNFPRVHSHNDYDQKEPFWNAYSAGAHSIEADVFLKDGVLYVTHAEDEIKPHRTLEELYIKALVEVFGNDQPIKETFVLQLLIDIKSQAKPTLEALVQLLNQYPKLIENPNLRFVISGSRPQPEQYSDYPNFIWFDHQEIKSLSDQALEKVALISMSFGRFSDWNGKGAIAEEELQKIKGTIKKAHSYDKPFRFWATPDSKLAWQTMSELGVDYINTDHPSRCVKYVSKLK